MVLLFLTLIPVAILIAFPLMQRLTRSAEVWQGQVTQGALWALVPLGVLWTLQMLDGGQGVLSIIPSAAGLGMLLLGSSGGWPALLSGRLLQGALILLSLMSFEVSSGVQAMAAGALFMIAAATADALLDYLGPQPAQPLGQEEDPTPLASPELSGPVLGAASVKAPARPPLPPPGQAARWSAERAHQAAQAASEDMDWIRSRRLEGQDGLGRADQRRLPS